MIGATSTLGGLILMDPHIKKFFGYSKYNGGHYPVIYYDQLPANCATGVLSVNSNDFVELPPEHLNKKIDELVLIYPYKGD